MPGSPTTPDLRVLALTLPAVLPSVFAKNVGVRDKIFSRLNGWPVHSPADASPPPLRATAHGLGPMWIATPSSYRTCTDYSLPVSRRTAKDSARYQWIRCNSYSSAFPYRNSAPVHKQLELRAEVIQALEPSILSQSSNVVLN